MVKGFMRNQVDLVYQNPVLNLIMIAVKNHFAVVLKERNGFSGIPALVLQRKM